MNRLRKIASWIWLNKERMILAIMVVVLCVRVYRVINPEPPDEDPIPQRARTILPADAPVPTDPPPIPQDPVPPVSNTLVRANPFLYVPPGRGGSRATEDDIGLTLVRVAPHPTGGWRAQIQSAGVAAAKWYQEGAKFEKYELLSVDGAADPPVAVVFAEDLGRRFELRLER